MNIEDLLVHGREIRKTLDKAFLVFLVSEDYSHGQGRGEVTYKPGHPADNHDHGEGHLLLEWSHYHTVSLHRQSDISNGRDAHEHILNWRQHIAHDLA